MSRFKKKDKKTGGGGGWIVTFSDLMSLLLTFFILLYSMSNVDAEKFKTINQSLQGVLSGIGYRDILETSAENIIPSNGQDDGEDLEDFTPNQSIRADILSMYDIVSKYVQNENLDAKVTVNISKKGVFVDINETILFDPGSAIIKESGVEVLNKLEGLINNFDNDIVIEGHTDDVPMNTKRFPSNWDLSAGRAISVLRYLTENKNVLPERVSAMGYGEYSPIVPNDSPENRRINRRVNILIIIEDESDGESWT